LDTGRRLDVGDGGGYTLGAAQQCTAPDLITSQGVVTEVDIESVAAAAPWLDGLKHYIQERLIPDVGKMAITNDDIELLFGGLSSASEVAQKHMAYVRTAIQSYRDIAESLDATSRVTEKIVKNYKDVEHSNAITVQNIDAAFASEPGSGGSTAGTSTSTSTSGGSNQGSF
jgi:hypothetical protein